jgi:hypothetical protein
MQARRRIRLKNETLPGGCIHVGKIGGLRGNQHEGDSALRMLTLFKKILDSITNLSSESFVVLYQKVRRNK